MAFLKKMFGGGSSAAPPPPRPTATPQETPSERMANTIDTIERKEKVLEKRIAEQTAKAKEYLAKKNQRGAMTCVKMKKQYEGQLEQLQNQKLNLETLKVQTEGSAIQNDIINVQREMVRQMNREAPRIEEVEQIQDDMTDALDNQRDVAEALAQPIAGGVDDDDVMDELMALEQEQEDEKFMSKVNDIDVTVPTGPVADGKISKPVVAEAEADDDEDVLAGLTAELNA
eukprot:TRINITY_DN13237_c1_g3_i1.p2 TRINITY_DN13237_c1_g3~~TRINITY_DN13237_c1_g3_i1.p2  ORF type:complete len:229 (+),score=79.95 TRINITY_DN13237_c1_g3_i1:61-747(+)